MQFDVDRHISAGDSKMTRFKTTFGFSIKATQVSAPRIWTSCSGLGSQPTDLEAQMIADNVDIDGKGCIKESQFILMMSEWIMIRTANT